MTTPPPASNRTGRHCSVCARADTRSHVRQLREVPVPVTESATILPQPRELPPLDLVDQDNRPLPTRLPAQPLDGRVFRLHAVPGRVPHDARDARADEEEARRPASGTAAARAAGERGSRTGYARHSQALRDVLRSFVPGRDRDARGDRAGGQRRSRFRSPRYRCPTAVTRWTTARDSSWSHRQGALAAYSSPPLDATVLARDFRKVVQYFEDSHR